MWRKIWEAIKIVHAGIFGLVAAVWFLILMVEMLVIVISGKVYAPDLTPAKIIVLAVSNAYLICSVVVYLGLWEYREFYRAKQ